MDTIKKIKSNLNELKKFESPLYIYDYDILKERCFQMKKFSDDLEKDIKNIKDIKVKIHYSPKANNNPAILKIVKEAGLYVDCMSPLELSINKKCGFKCEDILYVCNNIDKNEMKAVHDSNVLICLDSISQVETWGCLYPNTDIVIRINPGTEGVGHSKKVITSGKETKFGVSEENIPKLLETAKKYNLNIIGVHQHLGSLFLDDKVDEYLSGVRSGLRIIKEYFEKIEIVDLGGGFGVPYKESESALNLDALKDKLKKELIKFVSDYPSVKEFKFEIGRFIPCEAGILMGTVNAVKFENDIYWIGTDLGMNELVRPSMYNSYHKISLLDSRNTEKIKANVCGNVCESGDIMGKDRLLNKPLVNDIILVHNAGAYGYSMASNYTGRARPAEVMLYDNEVKLIRKRETISDMESMIVW